MGNLFIAFVAQKSGFRAGSSVAYGSLVDVLSSLNLHTGISQVGRLNQSKMTASVVKMCSEPVPAHSIN